MDDFTDELREKVEANGDVLAFRMRELRDGYGYGRLGRHVCAKISKQLSGGGLGHAPDPLPEGQYESTLVYKRGTQIEEIVLAVLDPSSAGASALRAAAGTKVWDALNEIKTVLESRGLLGDGEET